MNARGVVGGAILSAALVAAGRAVYVLATHRAPLRELLASKFDGLVAASIASIAIILVAMTRLRSTRADSVRRCMGSLAALRLALVVFVASSAVYLAIVDTSRILHVEVWLGVTGGVFALLWTIGPLLPRPRWWRAADFALFNVALAVVGVEALLHVAARTSTSPLLAREDAPVEEKLAASRVEPGHLWFGFPFNSLGFYDDEPERRAPGRSRVCLLGDSFSVGVVPHAMHYATICERLLGVPVDNVGHRATGPYEYLHLYESRMKGYDPDVVVACIFLGNDLHDAYRVFRTRRGGVPWLDRRKIQLWELARRLTVLEVEAERREVDSQPLGAGGGRAADRRVDASELGSVYPWLLDQDREPMTFTLETYLAMEEERARYLLDAPSRRWRALLDAVDDLDRAAGGARFAVMMIPDDFQVNDALWEQLAERLDASLAAARFEPQRVLGEALATRGIPCLDLLAELRRATENGRYRCYQRNDSHFNALGNRVAGEELARFLAPMIEPSR